MGKGTLLGRLLVLLALCLCTSVFAFAQSLSGGARISGGAMLTEAPCDTGTMAALDGTNCTLNGAIFILYPAGGTYNPGSGDCSVTGTGFNCPAASSLQMLPDCSTGGQLASCKGSGPGGVSPTRLIHPSGMGWSVTCTGPCGMTLQVHNLIEFATQAGPRLNGAGGSGNFSITGTQTIDGTATSIGSCTTAACGTVNFPACLTTTPYCTVIAGTPANFTTGSHVELSTLTFNCTSGSCTFHLGSLGDHDSQ